MAEVNFALQDVPETGVGSGLSDFELGLRLRYEVVKEFAPYVGVEWARKVGDTARFARGADASGVSFVMRSEEHTSELQSLMRISYAVFCLKKKKQKNNSRLMRDTNYSTTIQLI